MTFSEGDEVHFRSTHSIVWNDGLPEGMPGKVVRERDHSYFPAYDVEITIDGKTSKVYHVLEDHLY